MESEEVQLNDDEEVATKKTKTDMPIPTTVMNAEFDLESEERRLVDERTLLKKKRSKSIAPRIGMPPWASILEYKTYIKRIFLDHLLDNTTYEQLDEAEANPTVDSTYNQSDEFIINHGKHIKQADQIYIDRSARTKDPFAYFYISANNHKTPWKTRTTVSVFRSVTHVLGRWLDQQLQPMCQQLPSYLRSSFELKNRLENLPLDLPHSIFLLPMQHQCIPTSTPIMHCPR